MALIHFHDQGVYYSDASCENIGHLNLFLFHLHLFSRSNLQQIASHNKPHAQFNDLTVLVTSLRSALEESTYPARKYITLNVYIRCTGHV